MIHGNTRITLRNPISGNIIKDVESENTFQSAVLSKGLRNLGSCNASVYNNSTVRSRDFWKEIVGGILLFKDDVTPGSSYMAKGNKMTANGSYGVTNNGSPMELGSWNDSESSASSSALTMVYDWSTSQGNSNNGKIKSICLTSRVGGYIGYGNPSGQKATLKNLTESQDLQSAKPSNTEYAPRCIYGNIHYEFELNYPVTELKIYKSHIPVSEASVFDLVVDTITKDVSGMHGDIIRNYGFNAYTDNNKIYLCPVLHGDFLSNGTIYVWEINPSDDSITEIEIVNGSGHNINVYGSGVSNGKLFVNNRASTYCDVFSLSNSAYIGQIPNKSASLSADLFSSNLPNGLTACTTYDTSDGRSSMSIYDEDNLVIYPTNGYYDTAGICYDATTDTLYGNSRYGLSVFNNPLYLATINNITEVVKDATLSMKVMYTLQEA